MRRVEAISLTPVFLADEDSLSSRPSRIRFHPPECLSLLIQCRRSSLEGALPNFDLPLIQFLQKFMLRRYTRYQ